jgi:hypothetical protein
MEKQTRRRFLLQTSSVATVGVLTAASALTAACAPQPTNATTQATAFASQTSLPDVHATVKVDGPVVAYISDLNSGNITILAGTQEFVYKDPEIVARLLNAMR